MKFESMNFESGSANVLKRNWEVLNVAYKPLIKAWGLYFKKEDGYDNRLNIVKSFADFSKGNDMILEIPGKCVLGGYVYGHNEFEDGDEIFTSNLKFVKRVGTPRDIMCATTESGNKYYFYSDEYNAYMFMLLGDMFETGKLTRHSYWYLPPKFWGKQFI